MTSVGLFDFDEDEWDEALQDGGEDYGFEEEAGSDTGSQDHLEGQRLRKVMAIGGSTATMT